MTRKLVVVGDPMVGKRRLLFAFCGVQFQTKYQPIVFDNYEVEIQVDGKTVRNTTFV